MPLDVVQFLAAHLVLTLGRSDHLESLKAVHAPELDESALLVCCAAVPVALSLACCAAASSLACCIS